MAMKARFIRKGKALYYSSSSWVQISLFVLVWTYVGVKGRSERSQPFVPLNPNFLLSFAYEDPGEERLGFASLHPRDLDMGSPQDRHRNKEMEIEMLGSGR
ncbi:unnamed protein product [Dovyalis caffra]|uniref:Uncharacterized protein n=1 Tax=Dovyalis caffra TaxID=77055 RepID=A0AAV1QNH9_9ROSI|nr:unnamed protein product [Dovyalis caffra]